MVEPANLAVVIVLKYLNGLNSWGPKWGDGGTFKIRTGDFEYLLHEGGEAMTAVDIRNPQSAIRNLKFTEKGDSPKWCSIL